MSSFDKSILKNTTAVTDSIFYDSGVDFPGGFVGLGAGAPGIVDGLVQGTVVAELVLTARSGFLGPLCRIHCAGVFCIAEGDCCRIGFRKRLLRVGGAGDYQARCGARTQFDELTAIQCGVFDHFESPFAIKDTVALPARTPLKPLTAGHYLVNARSNIAGI